MIEVYEIEPDENEEPQDGDYVMSDSGPLGSHTTVSIVGERIMEEFSSMEEAEEAIREDMRFEDFYPSVWILSDHGNYVRTVV